MKIRFTTQAVLGTHVYGDGQVVELDDRIAAFALRMGYAVEHVEPPKPVVREAVSASQSASRKAVART